MSSSSFPEFVTPGACNFNVSSSVPPLVSRESFRVISRLFAEDTSYFFPLFFYALALLCSRTLLYPLFLTNPVTAASNKGERGFPFAARVKARVPIFPLDCPKFDGFSVPPPSGFVSPGLQKCPCIDEKWIVWVVFAFTWPPDFHAPTAQFCFP